MISSSDTMALVLLWTAYGLFLALAVGTGLWWAKRAGQFRDQDHARYLPLEADIPDDVPDEDAAHV